MTLSVIVTSCDSPDLLERCLESLTEQSIAHEIVVADCSTVDPSRAIRCRFPTVRVLRCARTSVPGLRWRAVKDTSGDIVAAVEARCTPAADWCEAHVRAHQRARDAPVVGGPVRIGEGASAFDWGLYLSEYAAFAPPLGEGPVRQLSSANLSYKRRSLETARDLLDQDVWEAALHERWIRDGRSLEMSSGSVTFQNGLSSAAALAMRFHYARAYAAERVVGDTMRRAILAAGTPLLPVVLTWRVGRQAAEKRMVRQFRRAIWWVAVLNVAWAAGELVGYVAGRPRVPKIF